MGKFLFTFIVLFLFWIGFTTSFHLQEIIVGAVVSLIIATFAYKSFSETALSFFHPKRLFYIGKYLVVFIIALLKSNFDVARRVISPSLPINPGIVKYTTKLKSDIAKVVLANSITLTPGTLTIDIVDDALHIHWLDVKSKDPDVIFKEVGEQFESILKEIFE